MKALEKITSYFVSQAGKGWSPEFPGEIAALINQLDNPNRRALRSHLFNEAKKLQLRDPRSDVLDWLQTCFHQIDRYTFRMHQVYFSPGYDILDNLRDLVYRAKDSLDLCIFSITDDRLAKAIQAAHHKDVVVRIITDDLKTNDHGSKIRLLRDLGIRIKIDHSRFHMHNKFGILDGRMAFTGSFNWTKTATRSNQENLLVTSNHDIVRQYCEEFERLWLEMYKY